MKTSPAHRLQRITWVCVLLFALSVIGYMWLEAFSFVDAVYMTVLALSTVGFGEVHTLSPVGRIFTIFVILGGVGSAAYLFGTFAEYLIAGELANVLRHRRMTQTIEQLHDHYIVCGYGRVGEQIAAELRNLRQPFVVIDRAPAIIEKLAQHNVPFVQGDATADEVLLQAGIQRARGLLAVLNEDTSNVYVTLSARALKRDLIIVARATHEGAESKLLKAGADRVVSPYVMAGHRIVSLLVHPNVVNVLDTMLRNPAFELWLEEITLASTSLMVGQTLHDLSLRERTGANVLVILRGSEQHVVDWTPQLTLMAQDVLIAMGKREQLQTLAQLAGDTHTMRPSRLRDVVS
jgi:voltage-gated potassium channel